MSLFDEVETLKKSWELVFQSVPPDDDRLCRWLNLAPLEKIEKAFLKSANWRRAQRVPPTQKKLEQRIKDTLYWMQANGVTQLEAR